jgi:hypothetical protein
MNEFLIVALMTAFCFSAYAVAQGNKMTVSNTDPKAKTLKAMSAKRS